MHTLQDGNDTIAPGSRTVHAAYDTQIAVAWLPENQTAVFAFRGSISAKNWLTGFQQWCGRQSLPASWKCSCCCRHHPPSIAALVVCAASGSAVPSGRLDGAPLAPVLEAAYPDARVHHGFLQSFQAVTSAAGNASTDLKCASAPAALRLPSAWGAGIMWGQRDPCKSAGLS